MKSTVDKKDGLSRTLKIEIPVEKVQDAFTKVYKGIQKNANIKGFRKGKAPLATIRSLYQDRVKQDVLEELLAKGYGQAIQEHALDPIGYPRLQVGHLNEESAFEFTAEVEVRPEVNLKKYESLKVQKEKVEVTEEQIGNILERVRQDNFETVPIFEDRGAQNGDIVKIDFAGFLVDGSPLEGAQAQDHMLELGSNSFIPGFEEGLEGMRAGQGRDLNLSFPADYHNAQVAGKPILFKVQLKELKKKSLPELNDDLAAKVSEHKTLVELKAAIKKDILAQEEKRVLADMRNRILKALVEANPVEVPPSLKAEQKERIIKDVEDRMNRQGMPAKDFEEYKQKWDSDFDKSAETMIQSSFLMDALADKLNLRAADEDLNARIIEQAQSLGLDTARVREFYKDADRRANLKFQITEERVLDYLIAKAEISEVEREKLSDPE